MSDRKFEILETKERVIADNDVAAIEVRHMLKDKGVFMVNLMSSPGAGKTTTLLRTIAALKDKYRIGVMEADVDSDVDAAAVSATGTRVIQLHTGGSCHMDADMTKRGLEGMDIDDLDLIFLENVGNLVCPAEFDVGANLKVMILSVPEGDDKPLKYPGVFQAASAIVLNKIDTAPVFNFDEELFYEHIKNLNPTAPIFPMSATNGKGVDAWAEWLADQIRSL